MVRLLLAVPILFWLAPQVQVSKNLRYYSGPGSDPQKHLLDLYLPSIESTFPLAIFVHGGSWRRGDKDDRSGTYQMLGRNLAQNGIAAAVINYRLSPQVRHPAHTRDVARAVAWATRKAHRYGWGQKQIFLIGHSAGAHLSSLVAVDASYLAEEGFDLGIIAGVVAISGVYDLTITGITGRMLYQGVFPTSTAGLRSASPRLLIQRSPCPFRLFHAENDYITADLQANRFGKALEEQGGQAKIQCISGYNHVSILGAFIEPNHAAGQAVIDFIHRNFRKQRRTGGFLSSEELPIQ